MCKFSFSKILTPIFVLVCTFSFSAFATASEKNKSAATPSHVSETPETKKQMADMYQKMADCMRTEKSKQECHKMVMKDCPMAKDTGHCPMMDGMMGMGMDMNKKKKMGMDMNMDQSEQKK